MTGGESSDLRAAAKALQREAFEKSRLADQQDHEAALCAAAAVALEAVNAERPHTQRLGAAVEGTVTAERTADDRVRAAAGYLAECTAAEKRAQDEHAAPDVQTEANLRVHAAAGVLARERAALDRARADREGAELALAAHRQRVSELESAHAAAANKAANPGTAPRTAAFPLGVVRPEDMDDEERQLLGALAILLMSGTERAGAKPALPGDQDPSKFQFRKMPNGSIMAIPPLTPR